LSVAVMPRNQDVASVIARSEKAPHSASERAMAVKFTSVSAMTPGRGRKGDAVVCRAGGVRQAEVHAHRRDGIRAVGKLQGENRCTR